MAIFSCERESKSITSIDEVPTNISLTTTTISIFQTIEGNLEERKVIIQTPSVIDYNKNYPMVFAFHGRGGTNSSWVNKLKSFTDKGEFIGIYPQGFLKSWNLGAEASKANDTEFVNLIVDELKKYNNLNFDKIYGIGTSNGSGLINKVAIETNHFKAIAPIVSQLNESQVFHTQINPVSVYQINGAADSTIPIDGGSKFGHVFLTAENSAKKWANKFECNPLAEIIMIGEDTLTIYKDCKGDKEIRYLRVENGEHNLQWGHPELFDNIWVFFQRF